MPDKVCIISTMKKRRVFIIIALLSGFYLISACAVKHGPVYEKNGKRYGIVEGNFTNRWYDYYERALSYMRGDYFSDALNDLDTAIAKRPEDRRWVNTYGMHFIDYFPHREKGVMHYLTGDYSSAEVELNRSITEEPSAKARYYLDKVRKELLLRKESATTIPEITLSYPETTRSEYVDIVGRINDENFVSYITFAGENLWLEASNKVVDFRRGVRLREGDNRFEISAGNLLGGRETRSVRILSDRSGPVIVVSSYLPGVEIQGYVYDASGISRFSVNGTDYTSALRNGFFMVPLTASDAQIRLSAFDILKNQNELVVKSVSAKRHERFGVDPALDRDGCVLSQASTIAADTDPRVMKVVSSCMIVVDGWRSESIVYKETIQVQGYVEHNTNIETVQIILKHPETTLTTIDILRDGDKRGRLVSFNASITLPIGMNQLVIRVRDERGHITSRPMNVVRKIPDILQYENRYALKIYPFDKNVPKNEGAFLKRLFLNGPVFKGYAAFLDDDGKQFFHDCLINDMLKRRRFQIVHSGAANMDGDRLLPDALLLGNTCVDSTGAEITARLIDLETFTEIISKDVFRQTAGRNDLKDMADELTEKFHLALPLSYGCIRDVSGATLWLDVDTGRIKNGWPFMVFRSQNSTDRADTIRLKGENPRILGCYTMNDDAEIQTGTRKHGVQKGDRIITK